MGGNFRSGALTIFTIVALFFAPSVSAEDNLLRGEWIGSFGCEGDLTYLRLSVGADQVALHAYDGTVLYRISEQAALSFTALQVRSIEPLAPHYPDTIIAQLVEPEDLLTGSLEGWRDAAAPDCTQFVLVRILQWPKAGDAER